MSTRPGTLPLNPLGFDKRAAPIGAHHDDYARALALPNPLGVDKPKPWLRHALNAEGGLGFAHLWIGPEYPLYSDDLHC